GRAEAETLTLTDGEVVDAGVATEHAAPLVDDHTLAGCLGRAPGHEPGVVVVWNETDFLAVRLVGDGQRALARVLAHGILRPVADREDGTRELILGQGEKEVRLILRGIDAALQHAAAGDLVALDPRVVSRRDGIGAEAVRPIGERRELQIA